MAERSSYVEVHERIQQFMEKYPAGCLQSDYDWVDRDGERWLVVKAWAYRDPDDPRPGIGHAWEPIPGRTPYTRGSELMVGETSAWGRALAALGIAVHQGIASAAEVRAAEGRKIERTTPNAADDDPWNQPAQPSRQVPSRRATAKQLQFITVLCKKMGMVEREQRLALVNAALTRAQLPAVQSANDMTDGQARSVIETLKAAGDDIQVAKDLLHILETASDQAADLASDDPS